MDTDMDGYLDNYRRLLERVDQLCAGIEEQLTGQLTCTTGCSGCCKRITLFPVEATALRLALERLPEEEQTRIRDHLAAGNDGERCPLLAHDRCLLYAARPIICRTHGLPIMFRENGESRVDCCPLNLAGLDTIPGLAVIDLDRLNELLVAVNALFVSQTDPGGKYPERLSIVEALTGRKRST